MMRIRRRAIGVVASLILFCGGGVIAVSPGTAGATTSTGTTCSNTFLDGDSRLGPATFPTSGPVYPIVAGYQLLAGDTAPLQSGLQGDPWVRDLATGTLAQLQLDDRVRVDAFAMNEIRGHVAPLVLAGRAPAGADEILVGTASLRSLGAHIGDLVKVSVGPVSARMRIVGRGPIPLGAFRDAGHSAWITFDTFKTLVPNAQPDLYLVNGPTGTTPSAADAYLARNHSGIGVFPHELPTDFANFGRVQRLPLIMGFILATLAGLTLVHALVMASRARRRELAILKTLGFVRRQVAGAVFSQATCLVAAAALIAVPLGVLVGRWSWNVFADRLGALAVPVIPPLQVVAIVAGGLLIALVAAAGPARAASRVKPAVIFRVE